MHLAAPSRRALGLAAVGAIAMSTTVLSLGGVAQADSAVELEPLDYSTNDGDTGFTVDPGYCTVDWTLLGAVGGDGSDDQNYFDGENGGYLEATTSVTAGQVFTFGKGENGGHGDPATGAGAGGTGTYPGGAGGTDLDPDGVTVLAAGGGGGSAAWAIGPAGRLVAAGGDGGGNADAAAGPGGSGDAVHGGNWSSWTGAVLTVNTPPGGSLDSSYVSAEVLPCVAAPLAPSDLNIDAGDGSLAVYFTPEWNDEPNSSDPDTWEYRIQKGNGAWSAWAEVDADYPDDYSSELFFPVTGLDNGATYNVQVRGVSEEGLEGAATASVSATPYAPIGAPTNVVATKGPSAIVLTWDAPTTAGTFPVAGYVVGGDAVSATGDGGSGEACRTTADVRRCVLPAEPGWTYTFGVTPVDSADNPGLHSASVTVSDVQTLAVPATVPAKDGDLVRPDGQSGSIAAGSQVRITGGGYLPGSTVTLIVYSDPQVLTTTVADASGNIDVTVTVPAGLASGNHTLVAAGVDAQGNTHYLTLSITVTGGTTGSGGLASTGSGSLAYTGAAIAVPAVGGLAALAVGGGLVLAGRRKRAAE